MTKAYITKYAITHGIYEVEGKLYPRNGWYSDGKFMSTGEYLVCKSIHGVTTFYPHEYRFTRDEAIMDAGNQRREKLIQLTNLRNKEIEDLKKKVILVFTENDGEVVESAASHD